MKSSVLLLSVTLASPMLFGCDGDSPSGDAVCEAFTACGGNLEGSWVIDGSCPESDLAATHDVAV